MVAIRDCQQGFSSVGFPSLVGWPQPDSGYYDMKCQHNTDTISPKRLTRKHGSNCENLIAAFEFGTNNQHFRHLRERGNQNTSQEIAEACLGIKRKFGHESSELGQIAVIIESSKEV